MGILKTLKRKIIMSKFFFSKDLSLSNQNILITGANSGIGLDLVKKLNNQNNILAFVNLNDDDLKISRGEISKMADNEFSESEVKLAIKKDGTNLYVVDKIRWVKGVEGTRYLWTEILDVTELIVSKKTSH